MKSIIRNFIAKRVAGRSDDGIMITLSDPKKVDFQAAMLEDLLMRNGIDPRAITSEQQLKNILNQIDAIQKQSTTTSGIRNTESAKVFDLEGKEIPKGSKIMGGKAIDDDLPPPGSRGGDDDIAAPVQSKEETLRNIIDEEQAAMEKSYGLDEVYDKGLSRKVDMEASNKKIDERNKIIKAKLEKQNKDSVKRILERKNREDVYGLEDYDTTNMSDIKKEIIRTETKLGNLNPTNPGFKERANVLINKIEELKKKLREDKADGGRIGFFMGSRLPKGLATLRTMLNYMGKKSDVVKKPSDVLKMVNPKSLNKMLEDPRLQGKVNIKEGILASDSVKGFQSKMGEDRIQLVKDMLSAAKNIKRSDDKILKYKNEIKERMMKDLNMSEAEADRAATAMSRLAMDITKMPNTPQLTDEGILQLENVLKNIETGGKKARDLNADGGRIGLKDGMNRRTFLKLLGGLASIPIIGKIVKPLKTVKGVKNVPIIKTDNVPGKPEWFDQLVNKVIIEGDDVTKKLATVEREIVHTKKINDTDEVTVYQDLNTDSVRVEYKSPDNMMEEPVDLSYKRTPPDEGSPQASSEFEVTESGFVGRADGPDDYFIDAEEVGGQSIKDLDSDVSALKEYATGQKPTMKEIVQKMKRKEKVKKLNEGDLDAQSDYITARQGDAYDYDDYASGGIARMLGE